MRRKRKKEEGEGGGEEQEVGGGWRGPDTPQIHRGWHCRHDQGAGEEGRKGRERIAEKLANLSLFTIDSYNTI